MSKHELHWQSGYVLFARESHTRDFQPATHQCVLCGLCMCFYITMFLDMREPVLLVSVPGNTCCCEQMFGLIKNVKSKTKMSLADEHVEGHVQISAR